MRTLLGVFVISMIFSLPACQATNGKPVMQSMADASLTAAVQRKLTSDRISNFARVAVDAEQGIVHLSGIVQTSEQRLRAEELAKQVKGVTRVDNSLRVQTAKN